MQTAAPTQPHQSSAVLPMIIIGVLFFVFGFVAWLNGSLIPFLKIVCELNEFQALFVTFAFYIAYTVMALPAALVLRRTGYKLGMVIGLGIMVIGSLIFAESISGRAAYIVMVPCYAFILFYALKGHKLRTWGGQGAAAESGR